MFIIVVLQTAIRNKRKRKRKSRLPPNYDLNAKLDPERWLPKRERSTYKDKRKKDKVCCLLLFIIIVIISSFLAQRERSGSGTWHAGYECSNGSADG